MKFKLDELKWYDWMEIGAGLYLIIYTVKYQVLGGAFERSAFQFVEFMLAVLAILYSMLYLTSTIVSLIKSKKNKNQL